MDLSTFVVHLNDALNAENGPTAAYLLRPSSPHSKDLVKGLRNPTFQSLIPQYEGVLISPWDEITVRYVVMCSQVAKKRSIEAFKEHEQLVNAFLRYFNSSTGWPLQVLFVLSKDLSDLAIDADNEANQRAASVGRKRKTDYMEAAARVINKGFTYCINDRHNPTNISRKWGLYYLATQAFKCYIRVKKVELSKSILHGIDVNAAVIPDLGLYPRSHRVSYRYCLGRLDFLKEDYEKADNNLTFAFYNCLISPESHANRERILTFLIPLRILRGHFPTMDLLHDFPRLQLLYAPFVDAIQRGDIQAYDHTLELYEPKLMKRHIYFVLERARDICLRGLFRRVWLSSSKSTRMPIAMFYASLRMSGMSNVTEEEAECFIANMIYKGFIRGYISHEKQMVVLAASNAFPRPSERASPFSMLI